MGDSISSLKQQSLSGFCASNQLIINNICDRTLTFGHFELEEIIGRGSQGEVYRAIHSNSQRVYALKIIQKDEIMKIHQLQSIAIEKKIMQETNSPFIQKLFFFLEDNTRYGFVTQLQTTDLQRLLQECHTFQESHVRIMAAEIVIALEDLHKRKYIYRDLKPENLLVDFNGHIKLTDFGISRQVHNIPNTFSGTKQYCAPEVILAQNYCFSVDYWSLGIIVFEMLTGKNPFQNLQNYNKTTFDLNIQQKDIYQNIIKGKINSDLSKLSENAKAFVLALLHINVIRLDQPQERLGSINGIKEIKEHSFFESINWKLIKDYQYECLLSYTNINQSTQQNTINENFIGFTLDQIIIT